MKRLLLLLLISAIAYAIVEDSNEYDDVSLEINYKPLINILNKAKGPIIKAANPIVKPAQPVVNKVVKQVQQNANKVVKPVQQTGNNVVKSLQQNANNAVKPLASSVIKNVVKPSINTVKKIEAPIKKMIDPAIKQVKKFLNDHPNIKKISDPFIKEIHKAIKDPSKTIHHILKDPKNAQKIVGKALKTIIDNVNKLHPLEKIKNGLKSLENFMRKNIPVKELKKFFVNTPKKILDQLSSKARNGIYWLKKKGYWEPIKFAVKTAGQYGATALCSAYLSPVICKPAVDLAFTLVVNKYIDKL
jgi:hypothetical protein